MATTTTRAGKGSALTHNELDSNFKKAAQTKAIAYTIAASDANDTIEYSGAGGDDFTMPDVATVVAAADTGDFEVTIKHVGTGTLGVTNTTGADTIDGSTNDLTLETNDVVTLKTNQGGDGYNIIAGETLNSVTQDNTVTLTNKTYAAPTITGLTTNSIATGITADAGQAQGGSPLTTDINEVATIATAGDSVTMPSAVAGLHVWVINTSGTAGLNFPASGDDLGLGVDTARVLAIGEIHEYICYDTTNWVQLS